MCVRRVTLEEGCRAAVLRIHARPVSLFPESFHCSTGHVLSGGSPVLLAHAHRHVHAMNEKIGRQPAGKSQALRHICDGRCWLCEQVGQSARGKGLVRTRNEPASLAITSRTPSLRRHFVQAGSVARKSSRLTSESLASPIPAVWGGGILGECAEVGERGSRLWAALQANRHFSSA